MATAKKTTTKRKRGAPSLYTKELAAKIVDLISQGYSEREICKMPGMPDYSTVKRWKDRYPEFCALSAQAREESAALYDDKRRQTNEWLRDLMEEHAKSGKPIPKGVVEAVRADNAQRMRQLDDFNNTRTSLAACRRDRSRLSRLAVRGEELLERADSYLEALSK